MEKNRAGVRASAFGRGAGSRRVRNMYMTPFSAPFGGFCPRLGSLCKGRAQECWPPVSGAGSVRFCAPGGLALSPVRTERFLRLSRENAAPADDADASATPGLLVCRTGTPDAPSGAETTGPVRRPGASPVSPEGDHFPRAPLATAYVRPPPKAPTPPRRNALRCIRGGMRGVWHGWVGVGKTPHDLL